MATTISIQSSANVVENRNDNHGLLDDRQQRTCRLSSINSRRG